MKKLYKYILIVIIMFFCYVGEVRAADYCKTANNQCVNVCTYETNDGDKYYISYDILFGGLVGSIDGENYHFLHTSDKEGTAFQIKLDDRQSLYEEKSCPKNVYYDSYGGELCFDSDGVWCKSLEGWGVPYFETKKDYKGLIHNKVSDRLKEACGNDCGQPICTYKKDLMYINLFYSENTIKITSTWDNFGSDFSDYVYNDNVSTTFYTTNGYNLINKTMAKGLCPTNVYKKNIVKNNHYQPIICFDWKNDDGEDYCLNNIGGGLESFFSKTVDESKIDKKNAEILYKDIGYSTIDGVYNKVVQRIKNNTDNNPDWKFPEKDILKICAYQPTPNLINNKYLPHKVLYVVQLPLEYRYVALTKNGYEVLDINKGLDFFEKLDCSKYNGLYNSFSPNEITEANYGKVGIYYLFSSKTFHEYNNVIDDSSIDNYDCESLLGSDLITELRSYMLYIKIAVPILLIVLCSIDFGKAIIASDEEAMKKAQKRFIQRLIIGVVIFFIPVFINILLNITSDIWNIGGNCEISF